MKTNTTQEQAENLLIQMDAVQTELESASDYELFESCKAQLAGLTSDIEALGFQVERCVTGWMLVLPSGEVATGATAETEQSRANILFYAQDGLGLYAAVKSSTSKKVYTVRVCAKWLHTSTCDCMAGSHDRDCTHRGIVEAALRDIRPTFSQWVAGQGASRETVSRLLYASGCRLVAHAA